MPLSENEEELLGKFFKRNPSPLGEDEVKQLLRRRLETEGWEVRVKFGKTRGIDIEAAKKTFRWIIEVKGFAGGNEVMQGEYFKRRAARDSSEDGVR